MDDQEIVKQLAYKKAMERRESSRIRWHWQNFNEDQNYQVKGSGFWHGRAWLYFFRSQLRVEWAFGKHSRWLGMSLDVGGHESTASLGIRIPYVFTIYLTLYLHWLRTHLPDQSRKTGWWEMEGSLWFELWHSHDWDGETGKQIVLHIKDWITGRYRYSEETISEHEAVVHLPDGHYPVKVRLYKSYWRYPRWWTRTLNRADIEMYTPIPIPVSEGMYELGLREDALYSITTTATTLQDALEAAVTTVMRDRARG